MVVMPQFPLGTVLFPSMVLPLHVFEPRYRTMIEEVLEGERTFGVVLIERGSEVGGDDQRSAFGTLAQIVEAERFNDGRWAVVTVGVDRFKVNEWLPDNPYPVADIELWPDETEPDAEACENYQQVVTRFRRCMALAAEVGVDVGPLPEVFDDVEVGCLAMSAMAPVGPLDKQRLLGASGAPERIQLLDQMIAEASELIELRLGGS